MNQIKSLIKSICYSLGNKFKNVATEWGKNNEDSGKASYFNKMKNDHMNFSLSFSGLLINLSVPSMGTSPDSIINCDCCGKSCLEIKRPYSIEQDGNIEKLMYLNNGKFFVIYMLSSKSISVICITHK